MDRISAAGNLSIEMQPDSWRLILNSQSSEQILVEAISGQPLRYLSNFATRRRLPADGVLPSSLIQQVVLGWSNEDETWHLGLVLVPELARARGSRWCEVARWPDPDATVFDVLATRAGRMLARTLGLPFNRIPPKLEAARPALVKEPAVPLPELPLSIDVWKLERVAVSAGHTVLRFKRAGSWSRGKILRIIWYMALIGVYLFLSIASLTSGIALPTPEWLPYVGIGAAAMLLAFVLNTVYQLLATPDSIIIDPAARRIAGLRGRGERWSIDRDNIESIYVSEMIRKRSKKDTVEYGELNLYLREGKFYRVLEQPETVVLSKHDRIEENSVMPLTSETAVTDLRAAGLYLSGALGVPCLYDPRTR